MKRKHTALATGVLLVENDTGTPYLDFVSLSGEEATKYAEQTWASHVYKLVPCHVTYEEVTQPTVENKG